VHTVNANTSEFLFVYLNMVEDTYAAVDTKAYMFLCCNYRLIASVRFKVKGEIEHKTSSSCSKAILTP